MLLVFAVPGAALATPPSEPAPPVSNDFIPKDQNLSDCVGTLERAGCGSSNKGGYHFYLVMLALAGGLTVIGWRITRSVKSRDREAIEHPTTTTF